MKQGFWLVAVIAAAFLGASLRTSARGDTGATGPKQVYQYQVFTLDYGDYKDKEDWKAIVERDGGNELRAGADFKTYVLNYLATQGWELVQVVPLKTEISFFYLRRPFQEGQTPEMPEGPGNGAPSVVLPGHEHHGH